MKITMTNLEAVHRLSGLKELETLSNPVPAAVGYRIVQNIHALSDALKPYQEVRDKTIRKYAPAGKTVISRDTDPDAFDACTAELAQIDHMTIDVDVGTFSLDAIAEGRFPLNMFFMLDFMIEKNIAKGV